MSICKSISPIKNEQKHLLSQIQNFIFKRWVLIFDMAILIKIAMFYFLCFMFEMPRCVDCQRCRLLKLNTANASPLVDVNVKLFINTVLLFQQFVCAYTQCTCICLILSSNKWNCDFFSLNWKRIFGMSFISFNVTFIQEQSCITIIIIEHILSLTKVGMLFEC